MQRTPLLCCMNTERAVTYVRPVLVVVINCVRNGLIKFDIDTMAFCFLCRQTYPGASLHAAASCI